VHKFSGFNLLVRNQVIDLLHDPLGPPDGASNHIFFCTSAIPDYRLKFIAVIGCCWQMGARYS